MTESSRKPVCLCHEQVHLMGIPIHLREAMRCKRPGKRVGAHIGPWPSPLKRKPGKAGSYGSVIHLSNFAATSGSSRLLVLPGSRCSAIDKFKVCDTWCFTNRRWLARHDPNRVPLVARLPLKHCYSHLSRSLSSKVLFSHPTRFRSPGPCYSCVFCFCGT
jgi:hypothetical protein